MTAYEIPLSAFAQQFQIPLGGLSYTLRLTWNPPAACWLLDMADQNNATLITSLPLQPGANMLAQFAYLGIPGELWVETDGEVTKTPGYPDLGVSGHLYYIAP